MVNDQGIRVSGAGDERAGQAVSRNDNRAELLRMAQHLSPIDYERKTAMTQ